MRWRKHGLWDDHFRLGHLRLGRSIVVNLRFRFSGRKRHIAAATIAAALATFAAVIVTGVLGARHADIARRLAANATGKRQYVWRRHALVLLLLGRIGFMHERTAATLRFFICYREFLFLLNREILHVLPQRIAVGAVLVDHILNAPGESGILIFANAF